MNVPALKKETIVYIHPDVKAKRCPCCGEGEMFVIMRFGANAPPFQNMINSLNNNILKQ
jgi:hypothetical protein